MAAHRFRVGEFVHLQVSANKQSGTRATGAVVDHRQSGLYAVVDLLHASSVSEPQYQLTHWGDQAECVAWESELLSAIHFPPPRY